MRALSNGLIAILFLALGLSACSEMKKVDEMKDNTAEMNETTKTLLDKTGEMKDGLDKMSSTTDKMATTTDDLRSLTKEELVQRLDDMNQTTSSLLDLMRQGDTSALRRASLQRLVQDGTLQGRVAEAGLYLMSFEFQALKSTGYDRDPAHREMLYHQAMLEFFLKIDEIAPLGGDVDPSAIPDIEDVTGTQNKTSAFNAIAFSLHKTNRQQVADPAYGRPMSFYDLIMVALKLKPEFDAGRLVLPDGPSFIKEVLARPARVRQLLQTRYNMFTYGLLGITTNLCEYGKFRQAIKLLGLSLDLTEKVQGPATLSYLNDEIMTPAAQTASDMVRVGIQPKFTTLTGKINDWVSIKFRTADTKSLTAMGAERELGLEQLWSVYKNPSRQSIRVR